MGIDKVYSHNEEDWVDDLQDAINASIEQDNSSQEQVDIKIGDKILFTHSKLSSGIGSRVIEQLQEWAYDECREFADDYLYDLEKDKIDNLSKVINEWLNKNAEQPNFYTVKNIKDFECSAEIALLLTK